MSLVQFLKANAKKVAVAKNAVFAYPVSKQKKYLESLSQPVDDIARSFCQYKCQMKLMGFLRSASLNILSFGLLLGTLLRGSGKKPEKGENFDAVFVSQGIPDNVIPQSLREEFSRIHIENNINLRYLDREDKRFFYQVWRRYSLSFQFALKILLKLSMYGAWKAKYNPKAFIVCSEYSFTSSVMTAYCQKNGILHIDVMHGEKLFYIRDTFFRFHRCYVWDAFYKDLFTRLRAEGEQFRVELPTSMVFPDKNVEKAVDYTFYLGLEGENELMRLQKCWEQLLQKGWSVAVRPHPRYTPKSLIEKFPEGILVEDGKQISIDVSVLRTRHVVSLYSTVLNQALHNGVDIVIDDLIDKDKYRILTGLEFICFNKPHKLLSEILKEG